MSVISVAVDHYARRTRLARAAARKAVAAWATVDRGAVASSWQTRVVTVAAAVVLAKRSAAADADGYLEALLAEQGLADDPAGAVDPAVFARDAADGRSLTTLLFLPAIGSLTAIRRGAPVSEAMLRGRLALERIARTEVADAGRLADSVAMTVRPSVDGYVRMLQTPSCARCAILAGRFYRWSSGFDRHPLCDCVHIPSSTETGRGMVTNPMAAFRAGQIHGLTEAETKAVRDGADLARVVNVKRSGVYAVGDRTFTREATGRRRRAIRPTPEQIYRDAADRGDAVRLLKRFGYIR